MQEQWKDIEGYEGIYEVSNIGRVRTKEGKKTHSTRHGERVWESRILKLKSDKKNYKRVSLYRDKKVKDFLVHRLVAYAFIPQIADKTLINHKDGNPSNNTVDNLEWVNSKENVNHAFDNGLMPSVKVHLRNLITGEIKEFRSMSKASIFLGRNSGYISARLLKGVTVYDDWELIK